MTREGDSTRTNLQAAEIALLVVRATLMGPVPIEAYRLSASSDSLTLDEAVRSLARLAKPLRCEGTMKDSIVAVACRALSDGRSLARRERLARRHAEIWGGAVLKRCQGPVENARIVLHNGSDSITVAFRALTEWFHDYDMNYSLGLDDTARLEPGICMVLEVGPPGTIEVDGEQEWLT